MSSVDDSIPEAILRPGGALAGRRWRTRLWWLTGVCGLIAVAVTASSLRGPGEKILVHFRDGYGIKPGDTLRYRGIDVGSVTEVHLTEDLQGIGVHIQLTSAHRNIAVQGSRFWIERPRLRIGQISGLETVLGAKFIGTIPGESSGQRTREFTGLENPLGMAEQDSVDIRIRFPAGDGLAAGDAVRYLGIDVGEVTYVEIDDGLQSVWVGARLIGTSQRLARTGTQFWVERPRLEISEIRGLETLVGGRYLALEPAAVDGTLVSEFVGLPDAPPLARRDGSLNIELEARSRVGLVRAAPITYRGIEVGRVADVSLASDGASVSVRAVIEPEFADLVRNNSQWWSVGGVRFDAGITGMNLSIDSFESWLRGGISFATPDPPGEKVVNGYRFGLAEKADAEWTKWQPRIATGPWTALADADVTLPRIERVAATWQTRFLGFSQRQSAHTWCLPLDNGQACLPFRFIKAAQAAKSSVALEIAGSSHPLDPSKIADVRGLAFVDLPKDAKVVRMPVAKIRGHQWNGKTALLLLNPDLSEPMPLDASRASGAGQGLISINAAVPLHKSMEGSAVLDTANHEFLGLLANPKDQWVVVPVVVK